MIAIFFFLDCAAIIAFQLWQAFVGTKKRRKTMERYYQDLLAMDFNSANGQILDESSNAPNQWKKQIEKVIRCKWLDFIIFIFHH